MTKTNPLLDFSDRPRFDAVLPEHVRPAIESLLDENRRLVDALGNAETPASWDDFVQPLVDAGERLPVPGALSGICIRSMTFPNGARPTTGCCRR